MEGKAKGGFFAPERALLKMGPIGGIILMAIAVAWFVLGYTADMFYFYPPVLFIIGLWGFVNGLAYTRRKRARGRVENG